MRRTLRVPKGRDASPERPDFRSRRCILLAFLPLCKPSWRSRFLRPAVRFQVLLLKVTRALALLFRKEWTSEFANAHLFKLPRRQVGISNLLSPQVKAPIRISGRQPGADR